jgi:hypothetical protein
MDESSEETPEIKITRSEAKVISNIVEKNIRELIERGELHGDNLKDWGDNLKKIMGKYPKSKDIFSAKKMYEESMTLAMKSMPTEQ